MAPLRSIAPLASLTIAWNMTPECPTTTRLRAILCQFARLAGPDWRAPAGAIRTPLPCRNLRHAATPVLEIFLVLRRIFLDKLRERYDPVHQ